MSTLSNAVALAKRGTEDFPLSITDKRSLALNLAAKGFKVFPVVANRKIAKISDWPAKATSDPATVKAWWTDAIGDTEDHNIGICCNDLLVIDIDATISPEDALTRMVDLQKTMNLEHVVATPSGGFHAYLKLPNGVRVANTARKLGPTTDTRSWHGYVLAPGSTIDGVAYAWLSGGLFKVPGHRDDLQTLPKSIIDGLAAPKEKAPVDQSIEWDTPAAVDQAVTYLKERAPLAIQGRAGNDTAYRVAAVCRDYAVSQDNAFQLMDEHWNNRCEPPWEAQELNDIVGNAYRYAKGSPSAPGSEFEAVDIGLPMPEPAAKLKARNRINILNFHEFADKALEGKSDFLIDGLIDENTVSVLFGESGSGKSFIAIDMAHSIAAGEKFAGKDVKHGYALYLALEGGNGIKKRFAALRQEKHSKPGLPFEASVTLINLFAASADTAAIVEVAKAGALKHSLPIKLVIIDTAARAMAGGDENSAEDVMTLLNNAERIRSETGAHVMLIHHPGKDKSKEERGSIVFRTNTDTRIKVEKMEVKGFGTDIKGGGSIKIVKQKDGDEGPFCEYLVRHRFIGLSKDSKQVTSLVVDYLPTGTIKAGGSRVTREPQSAEETPSDPFRRLAKAVADAYDEDPPQPGEKARWAKIRTRAGQLAGEDGGSDGIFKRAVNHWGHGKPIPTGDGRLVEILKPQNGAKGDWVIVHKSDTWPGSPIDHAPPIAGNSGFNGRGADHDAAMSKLLA